VSEKKKLSDLAGCRRFRKIHLQAKSIPDKHIASYYLQGTHAVVFAIRNHTSKVVALGCSTVEWHFEIDLGSCSAPDGRGRRGGHVWSCKTRAHWLTCKGGHGES